MKSLILFAFVLAAVVANPNRCGTKSLDFEENAKVNQEVADFVERECNKKDSPVDPRLCSTVEERQSDPKRDVTSILVAHHVIYDPAQNNKGNLTQQEIDAQMAKLNADYTGSDFQFETYTITRTANTDWFNELGKNTQASVAFEVEMTYALAQGLPYVMQVYWVQPANGILGYAFYPNAFAEDSPDHCIVMHYATVPGGALSPYNEGRTLVHELGHALGLAHTFDNGCTPPGDNVDDTNYVAEANYNCPSSHTSCGTPDPVDNFMDYVDDACMDTFTAGQMQRMVQQVTTYRPSLLKPEDAPPPSSATSLLPYVFLVFASVIFTIL